MKIVILQDGWIGEEIAKVVKTIESDEVICLTPAQFKPFDADLAVNKCPQELVDFQPDWLISAWWPRIIPPCVVACAKHTLNTHNSLLPYCRGKHGNFWSIVEGFPYGVSLHEITPIIDGGAIYCQEQFNWRIVGDTGGSLYKWGLDSIVALFQKNWVGIRNGTIVPRPQNREIGSFHEARELEPARTIDLDAPTTGRKLFNVLRAAECGNYTAHFRDGIEHWDVKVVIKRRSI